MEENKENKEINSLRSGAFISLLVWTILMIIAFIILVIFYAIEVQNDSKVIIPQTPPVQTCGPLCDDSEGVQEIRRTWFIRKVLDKNILQYLEMVEPTIPILGEVLGIVLSANPASSRVEVHQYFKSGMPGANIFTTSASPPIGYTLGKDGNSLMGYAAPSGCNSISGQQILTISVWQGQLANILPIEYNQVLSSNNISMTQITDVLDSEIAYYVTNDVFASEPVVAHLQAFSTI